MPYDKNLDIPQFKNGHNNCNFIHAHASTFTFYYNKPISERDEQECEQFFSDSKAAVKSCMFFANSLLECKTLSPIEKATLKTALKKDKELLKHVNMIVADEETEAMVTDAKKKSCCIVM